MVLYLRGNKRVKGLGGDRCHKRRQVVGREAEHSEENEWKKRTIQSSVREKKKKKKTRREA